MTIRKVLCKTIDGRPAVVTVADEIVVESFDSESERAKWLREHGYRLGSKLVNY